MAFKLLELVAIYNHRFEKYMGPTPSMNLISQRTHNNFKAIFRKGIVMNLWYAICLSEQTRAYMQALCIRFLKYIVTFDILHKARNVATKNWRKNAYVDNTTPSSALTASVRLGKMRPEGIEERNFMRIYLLLFWKTKKRDKRIPLSPPPQLFWNIEQCWTHKKNSINSQGYPIAFI